LRADRRLALEPRREVLRGERHHLHAVVRPDVEERRQILRLERVEEALDGPPVPGARGRVRIRHRPVRRGMAGEVRGDEIARLADRAVLVVEVELRHAVQPLLALLARGELRDEAVGALRDRGRLAVHHERRLRQAAARRDPVELQPPLPEREVDLVAPRRQLPRAGSV
jgi:hypothetical protein